MPCGHLRNWMLFESMYSLRDSIARITIESNRFDFEPEITAKILKKNARFKEIPISYNARQESEGKKITWKDGVQAIFTLLKYRFK